MGALSTRDLLLGFGIALVLCSGMYWLAAPLGGIYDGAYFLDRLHLIVRGMVPYRDFEFVYGSASLYASLFLARLLHITPDNGYHVVWFAESLAGVYLLWLSIRWIDLPAEGKRTVYWLYFTVAAIFIINADTLNYCILRYSLPLFAVTGLCRLDRDIRPRRRVEVVAFAALVTWALLNLSPEEGLVYGVAVCLYLPLRRSAVHQPFLPDIAAFFLLFAGLSWQVAHAGTFSTMARFSAGAFNLPIYPGPHILLTFAALFLLICYVVGNDFAARVRANVAFLLLFSLGLIPAVLGRCDATHVVGYMIAALICAMLIAWQWPMAWRFATVGFAIVLIMLPFAANQFILPPTLSKALLNHIYRNGVPQSGIAGAIDREGAALAVRFMGQFRGMAKITALRNSAAANATDPRVIFPGASQVVSVPFEYIPNKVSNYQAPWVYEGHYMGLLNILVPSEVDSKVAELRDHPDEDLVVSNQGLVDCSGARGGDRLQIRVLLLLPWVPKPKNELPLLTPICTYIRENYDFVYQPSPATFEYGLMRRKLR